MAKQPSMKVGDTFQSNKCGEMVVVEYINWGNVRVKFSDGHEVWATTSNIRNGAIKNPYNPSVFGIGYMGVGEYKSKDEFGVTHMYQEWKHMLQRCYDLKFQEKHPTYKGCTVDPLWHNFQAFGSWYMDNYYQLGDEQMALDKDILLQGNKIYSQETCCFVPQPINKAVNVEKSRNTGLPPGVHKTGRKYAFQVSDPFFTNQIGDSDFNTPKEAFEAYSYSKEGIIKNLANHYRNKYGTQFPDHIYNALMNWTVKATLTKTYNMEG